MDEFDLAAKKLGARGKQARTQIQRRLHAQALREEESRAAISEIEKHGNRPEVIAAREEARAAVSERRGKGPETLDGPQSTKWTLRALPEHSKKDDVFRTVVHSADRVALPPSVLKSVEEEGASYPLYFRVASSTGKVTHVGVREFSAEEGEVRAPEKVLACLGISYPASLAGAADLPPADSTDVTVEVTRVQLPKGTFARLRALEDRISHIPNFKEVLESQMRAHYATLTRGDVLCIGGVWLRVDEISPDDEDQAVSLIDTDLSVDLVELFDAGGGTTMELEKEVSGRVGQNETAHHRFRVPRELRDSIERDLSDLVISLQKDPPDSGDLYVSFPPLPDAQPHRHHLYFDDPQPPHEHVITLTDAREALSSHASGAVAIPFAAPSPHPDVPSSSAPTEFPATVFIGVVSGTEPLDYKLTVRTRPHKKKERTIPQVAESDSPAEICEGVCCENCGRYVPTSSIDLHLIHCRRNLTRCSTCKLILKRAHAVHHTHCDKCGIGMHADDREKHMNSWHSKIPCACGKSLERLQLEVHRLSECPFRLVLCKFCGTYECAGLEASDPRDRLRGLSGHEAQCGSRTIPCAKCQRLVMLKELELHMIAVHDMGNEVSAKPQPDDPKEKLVPCPHCGISGFASATQWTAHVDSHF